MDIKTHTFKIEDTKVSLSIETNYFKQKYMNRSRIAWYIPSALPTQNRYPWSLHSVSIRGQCHGKCQHTDARMRRLRWRRRNGRIRCVGCANYDGEIARRDNWTNEPQTFKLNHRWLSCEKKLRFCRELRGKIICVFRAQFINLLNVWREAMIFFIFALKKKQGDGRIDDETLIRIEERWKKERKADWRPAY